MLDSWPASSETFLCKFSGHFTRISQKSIIDKVTTDKRIIKTYRTVKYVPENGVFQFDNGYVWQRCVSQFRPIWQWYCLTMVTFDNVEKWSNELVYCSEIFPALIMSTFISEELHNWPLVPDCGCGVNLSRLSVKSDMDSTLPRLSKGTLARMA